MPKGKTNKGQGTKATPSNGAAITKTAAVKQALTDLGNDAMPVQIREHIRKKFGLVMDTNLISNYKSTLKREAGKKAAAPQPKGRSVASPAKKIGAAGGISLDDIRAVKQLVARLGADRLRELAEVLSK